MSVREMALPVNPASTVFDSLLDSTEAAKLLRIHPRTLTKMARRKQVPSIQIGRLWRFRKSDLDAWVTYQVSSSNSSFRGN